MKIWSGASSGVLSFCLADYFAQETIALIICLLQFICRYIVLQKCLLAIAQRLLRETTWLLLSFWLCVIYVLIFKIQ